MFAVTSSGSLVFAASPELGASDDDFIPSPEDPAEFFKNCNAS